MEAFSRVLGKGIGDRGCARGRPPRVRSAQSGGACQFHRASKSQIAACDGKARNDVQSGGGFRSSESAAGPSARASCSLSPAPLGLEQWLLRLEESGLLHGHGNGPVGSTPIVKPLV